MFYLSVTFSRLEIPEAEIPEAEIPSSSSFVLPFIVLHRGGVIFTNGGQGPSSAKSFPLDLLWVIWD